MAFYRDDSPEVLECANEIMRQWRSQLGPEFPLDGHSSTRLELEAQALAETVWDYACNALAREFSEAVREAEDTLESLELLDKAPDTWNMAIECWGA